MKVALAGPSGTGKTTLTEFIEQNTELKFTSNSAQNVFTKEDKKILRGLGYHGTGHKEVVQLSMQNEKFAGEFQRRLLWRRGEFIVDNDKFIIDRSPMDNLAYFMYQSSFLTSELFIDTFVEQVKCYLRELDLIIFIPTTNEGGIENNGSRVNNYYFQRMISQIFWYCLEEFDLNQEVQIETIDFWDLERRKEFVLKTIEGKL